MNPGVDEAAAGKVFWWNNPSGDKDDAQFKAMIENQKGVSNFLFWF